MIVQVYGITTPEDAGLVNGLRPDNVGVVLDEGIDTWDSVDEHTARAIVHELTDVTIVALSLMTDRDRILRTVDTLKPGVVHLARAADGMSADELARLHDDLEPIQLMVTIPVRGPSAVEQATILAPTCDYLLLDTAHPKSGVVGATGYVHDWSISRRVVDAVDVPVILAGGLGPDNVVEAIAQVSPAGVDSETRTSTDHDRRRKDPAKVQAFIQRARSAT